ncbi:hypothetical protein [Microbacterium indicum]|uniref:hypothetical protein n=1 Tax=Microbacterium indicum TaxID=358100 RepID=UPI0003FF4B2E|nr:hypothetical protein [Microbacterium indicum]
MHVLTLVLTGLKETPVPQVTVDADAVTPGPWGFAVLALVAIAVVLLVLDMLRRVRRARYRDEAREALDAEEAAARRADEGDGVAEPDGSAEGGVSPR